ncbi:hypothetical protein JCM5353_008436 [Sporobolomyces roseus]
MTSLPVLPPDSSSSDSSLSLPCRPFSQIPTELAQHIIESTIPLSFHSHTYLDRQSTLRSLCLVSRLFRQIAQPVLLDVAYVRHPGALVLLGKAIDTFPEATKDLVVHGFEGQWFPKVDFLPLFDKFLHLRHLVIVKCRGEMDVTMLERIPHLSSLRLADFCIAAPPKPFVLTRLREAQLLNVVFDKAIDEILSPQSAPELRLIALYEDGENLGDISRLLDNFLPQLQMISLDYGLVNGISSEVLAKISHKTLFDQNIAANTLDLGLNNLRLYRFVDPSTRDRSDEYVKVQGMRQVEENLRAGRPGLLPKHLYLPFTSSSTAMENFETSAAREDLMQTAESHGVKVVFEEQPADWTVDSGISVHFMRRMQEIEGKNESA